MKRIIAALCMWLASTATVAQVYVAAGVIEMEPEVTLGYQFGMLSAEVSNYGPVELYRIQRITSAEVERAEGVRASVRLNIPVNAWADITMSAGAVDAKYESPVTRVREVSASASVGAMFKLDTFSKNASFLTEYLYVDSPNGFYDLETVRMVFRWSFGGG